MPKISISKSIIIKASQEKIKEFLADFHNWKNWSPWLICEPEAKVDYAADGKYYKWEGKRVGSGEMKVIEETDSKIDYDLTFLKPWKSEAKVYFEFEEKAEGTKVTWLMDSSLPFFMFWMKKAMITYVGMDYERGLKMLKEELEEGKIHSELEFVGKTTFEGYDFIGVRTETTFTSIGKAMANDFTKLHEYIKENNIEAVGVPFSEYRKFNPVKDKVVYVAGIPVKNKENELRDGLFYGSLPKSNIATVRHTGKYDHLGNAWSALMMMDRSKEIKKFKKGFPMEIYINDPTSTKPEELIVDISIPVV